MEKSVVKFSFLSTLLVFFALAVNAQNPNEDQLKVFQNSDLSKYSFDLDKKAKTLAKDQDILEFEDAYKVYMNALLRISSMINSGDFYVNDEISQYLEEIISKIDPDNNNETGIYRVLLSKSSIPNAFCVVDGTVIVNIGLIGIMENESQLAGVLAHEISHFKKKHSLKQVKASLENQSSGRRSYTSQYLSMKYSRESEYEADAGGLNLVAASPFNANDYSRALELVTGGAPQDTTGVDVLAFFKSDVFKLDTSIITDKEVKRVLRKSSKKEGKTLLSGNDDMFESHPEGQKRQLAATEILSSIDYKAPTTTLNSDVFKRFQRLASYEMVKNDYFRAEYLQGLHNALKLLDKYPSDQFAQNMIVSNLYWLCNLKSAGVLSDLLDETEIMNITSLAKLKLIFKETPNDELGKFLFTYLKKLWEADNSNETVLYYLASAADIHLGKETAKIHYKNYSTKFPKGIYISNVNEKLQ
jgi:Zn-dependent protease with chaperone function